jgi:hypothetical protein
MQHGTFFQLSLTGSAKGLKDTSTRDILHKTVADPTCWPGSPSEAITNWILTGTLKNQNLAKKNANVVEF